MVKSLRIVGEVDESIAIVDLDIKQTQHCEPKQAGDFGTDPVAGVSQVERDQILIFLLQAAEAQPGYKAAALDTRKITASCRARRLMEAILISIAKQGGQIMDRSAIR
jgi:hypothetical protein